MIQYDVVDGVHLIEHAYTNLFVIEGAGGLTLVDAGYPSTWPRVQRCLASINRTVNDVRGLVITHGHFDHLGFAVAVQQEFGVEVWVIPVTCRSWRTPTAISPRGPGCSTPSPTRVHCRSQPRWRRRERCVYRG